MLQTLLVGAIVTVAAAYAVWALVPGLTRLELARKLGAWGRAPGRAAWIARATAAIERTAAERQGGCGSCGSGPPARPPERERSRR